MVQFYILNKAAQIADSYDASLGNKILKKLDSYSRQYSAKGGRMPEDMQ
jgi:hypothetical protein